mmetsp:Transcript_30702/g.49215  ORF Transcript_30702/g.49215 Transcript_30702/m.49215 type:complete len:311 (+) Transcript_30702:1253-2185(+)
MLYFMDKKILLSSYNKAFHSFQKEFIRSIKGYRSLFSYVSDSDIIRMGIFNNQSISINLKSSEIIIRDQVKDIEIVKMFPTYPIKNNYSVYRNDSFYSSNWNLVVTSIDRSTTLNTSSKIILSNNFDHNPRCRNLFYIIELSDKKADYYKKFSNSNFMINKLKAELKILYFNKHNITIKGKFGIMFKILNIKSFYQYQEQKIFGLQGLKYYSKNFSPSSKMISIDKEKFLNISPELQERVYFFNNSSTVTLNIPSNSLLAVKSTKGFNNLSITCVDPKYSSLFCGNILESKMIRKNELFMGVAVVYVSNR